LQSSTDIVGTEKKEQTFAVFWRILVFQKVLVLVFI